MTQHSSGTNTLWEGVLSAIQGPGGSRPPEPFSEVLQRVIYRHIAQEESSIERYKKLLEASKDPVVRMLISELLHDEEHHHGMLRRMEAQLSAELGETLDRPLEGDGRDMRLRDRRAAVAEIRDLAAHETTGVKHLREVAKEARENGSDLLGVLLDAMASDSQKHERILKFIAKRVANP